LGDNIFFTDHFFTDEEKTETAGKAYLIKQRIIKQMEQERQSHLDEVELKTLKSFNCFKSFKNSFMSNTISNIFREPRQLLGWLDRIRAIHWVNKRTVHVTMHITLMRDFKKS
jgi:hypothetical protein